MTRRYANVSSFLKKLCSQCPSTALKLGKEGTMGNFAGAHFALRSSRLQTGQRPANSNRVLIDMLPLW